MADLTNTLHVKLEWPDDGCKVGHNAKQADRIVDECGERGLYVILCVVQMTDTEENYDNEVKFINVF